MDTEGENEPKGKLNLTVSPQIRRIADQVAKLHNRSVSNLFEILVEREWRQAQAKLTS